MSLELSVAEAAAVLRRGQLALIPTETVYGLAANALDAQAVASIFEAKGRPHFNPIICHVSGLDALHRYARVDALSAALADQFWPGPLSLVLEQRGAIPPIVSGGGGPVAFRAPDHPQALALLHACDFPLAAPSANLSGRRSPTTAAMACAQLSFAVAGFLEGGPCRVGLESTVLQSTPEGLLLLREGGLTREELQAAGFEVVTEVRESGAPRSPGQLLQHYAPDAPLLWLEGWTKLNAKQREDFWRLTIAKLGHAPGRIVLLSPLPPEAQWLQSMPPHRLAVLAPSGNLREAAAALFSAFEEWASEADLLVALPAPEAGLGRAINDRLRRAASARLHPDSN
ncbi:MAG: threonylcarbamoyl-AMP synthase [Leptospirales bacterium]|nr:threonylcarbamoyl-AMP synthase [Leptospirales bacterium]